VDVEAGRDVGLDLVEELAELARAVLRVATADHRAGGDVEGGEERGGAMARVVMAALLHLAGPHRQQLLGAVERLDLGFLVHTQHQRPVRRAQVEPDDVAHLLDEQRIVRQLEGLAPVRLQAEGPPDAVDGGGRIADRPSHRAQRPMRPAGRRGF
jgi:hypothetical protein